MRAPNPGLVDVNHAPLLSLLRLPGVDGTLAGRIITVRRRVGGFSSLDEMGAVLALDERVVEGLRDWVECLPG